MSYDLYLFRKEIKEQNRGLACLEDKSLAIEFTDAQFVGLKKRLLRYGFQIISENAEGIHYGFKGGKFGVLALLCKSYLSFSSGFSEDGIFEINMIASELIDTGEFAKYDPQEGEWEVWGE